MSTSWSLALLVALMAALLGTSCTNSTPDRQTDLKPVGPGWASAAVQVSRASPQSGTMRSPLLGTKEWLRALDLDEVTAVRTSHVRHEAIGLRERYYRDVCSVMGLRQLVREVKATRETGLDFCDCMPSAVIEIAFQSDDRLFIFPTSGGDTLGLIHFRGKAEVGRVTMEIAGSRALLDRIVDPGRGLIQ